MIWLKLGAAVALFALLAWLVYAVNHLHNAAWNEEHAARSAAEASIKAAQERATAIALLWAGNVTKEEVRAKQSDADRTQRFAPILSAAHRLPPAVAGVVFPAAAARLLDAAIDAGNASIAGSPAPPAEGAAAIAGAATDVASVTQWGVDVARLYSACRDQVVGCQSFYGGLQESQLVDQIH